MRYNKAMEIAQAVAIGVLTLLLIVIAAVRIVPHTVSERELNRRRQQGDKHARHMLQREKHLALIISLQKLIVSLLLVGISIWLVLGFGWVGVAIVAGIVLFYAGVASTGFMNSLAQPVYEKIEPSLIKFVKKFKKPIRLFKSISDTQVDQYRRFDSKEELEELLDRSEGVLTEQQKRLIVGGLGFFDKEVKEIMTPRARIKTVGKNEVLGPLTLDDLHKTGHSRIPVINKNLDHVVGILMLRNLLIVDSETRESLVEKAMDAKVFHIRDNQPLSDALAIFLNTDARLLIATNRDGKTTGLLTLGDVIEALMGERPADTAD